jgi:hypothetical protein
MVRPNADPRFSSSCTGGAKCGWCGRRRPAAASSSWCAGCFAPIAWARLSSRFFLKFSFPPRWHYDILRALDYFQSAGSPRDDRLSEVIDIVRNTQRDDGRWPLDNSYKDKTWFQLERVGAPSRWNTLRALRVLKWWNKS